MTETPDKTMDEPLNELESELLALMRGDITQEQFLNTFVQADLYIMVDGEPAGNVLGDKQPLVFAVDDHAPSMLAVFSNPARASVMVEHFGEYNYPIMVNTSWVLEHIGPDMGVAFNPGCLNGFELAPAGAQELKKAVAEARFQSGE